MYPVNLNVRGKAVLVVGGGGVALRKIQGLCDEGAKVTVVATQPIEPIKQMAAHGPVTLHLRSYQPGEVNGYALAFAATDQREVNRQVFADGEKHGVWVNVADDPELCAFHLPARVRRGALQLSVASAGEAPFVVRRLRQFLERRFGNEWAEWIEAAARFREKVRASSLSQRERETAFERFFNETVKSDPIQARVPTVGEQDQWLEQAQRLTAGAPPETKPAAPSRELPEFKAALVSLTGAGPGDPGLLTLRGHRRLMACDAVVFDRLAETALPCDLPVDVELHSVGKRAGHHAVPQEEINALLIRLAQQGKRVVRLKGGDPFVFGRGGEEAIALREAGVPFEVVPAPSAGVAVPAYAGIPVTHRKETVRVTLVTAHESIKEQGPQVRWDLLAEDPRATLLGYMGVTSLPQVTQKLLDAGMNPDTPAAMIERGTTSRQRVVRSTVAGLPDAVKSSGIKPPALFVIGPTVAHAHELEWYVRRPLFGHRILAPQGHGLFVETLELAGADMVETPLPVPPAARIVIGALPLTGCLFGSPEEVDALEDERDGLGFSPKVTAYCLTAETAERARSKGWQNVVSLPDEPAAAVRTIYKG